MSQPTVFISYSHKDEHWKNLLMPHLKVLAHAGRIDIWDDRKIDGGSQWFNDIKEAIDRAAVAVCLISADYLASDFCVKEEIPYLLARRDRTVLVILPTLLHPCLWEVVEWLKNTQMIPRDGKSISGDFKGNENEAFRQVAKSVLEIVDDPNRQHPEPPLPSWPPPEKMDTKRLPVTGSELFGRQRELKMLDEAWESAGTHVVSLVAWGGVGKSTLVNKWLEQMEADNYRGARRVYAWSFYSQGTNERVTSADLFINNALDWFGDPDPTAGSPWDKGERLARLVQSEKTLLLLDGLEPLQSPHAHERGKIKDPALSTLLTELARENQGLCVITTRERVSDLDEFTETVLHKDLEQISDEAGRALLRIGGVRGTDAELEQATRDFGNHALAIQLLAVYLHDIPGHHVSHASEIPDLDIPIESGKHPRRLLAAFEQRFGPGPEVELLRMLGLFDRPADAPSLAALRAAPPIPGLTEHIQELSEAGWVRLVDKLRRANLIAHQGHYHSESLDAHPLVREHFGQQLRGQFPTAWRKGNDRLYEHLKRAAPETPQTVGEIMFLYDAVIHGCAAGRHPDAFREVYWPRILQGSAHFSWRSLGLFSADLAATINFFDLPWSQPSASLAEHEKDFFLNQAGMGLRAIGRSLEAIEPMVASYEFSNSLGDPLGACISAINVSELYVITGDLQQAVTYGEQGVKLAHDAENVFHQSRAHAILGDALFKSGQDSEAMASFFIAEELHKSFDPDLPFIFSVWGFRYCELLLAKGNYQETITRANATIIAAAEAQNILSIALDRLSLGRAYLLRHRYDPSTSLQRATEYLSLAVNELRRAGVLDMLPLGLLARAELYLVKEEPDRARVDLGEAVSIATNGGMLLYQADCHLEYARLYLAQGEREKARGHWVTAKGMVERIGYHLRDEEVREIGEQLG